MTRIIPHVLLILWSLVCCLAPVAQSWAQPAPAEPEVDLPTTPALKPDGSKWRIGYYEGGQYQDYKPMLYFLMVELEELGWLELERHPDYDALGHRELWDFFVENAHSDYLELVQDAWYAPGNFDEDLRPKVRKQVIERLNEQGDIDLMLAMGTWAGQDLATDEHSVPVEVISSSDPVGAGIVAGPYDAGLPHVHTKVEPWRYSRQLEVFHEFVQFERLGVVLEPTPEGRHYAALDDVYAVASRFGFEVVECHASFHNVDQQEAEAQALACYEELAPQVDAVYVTVHRGVNPRTLAAIVPLLNSHRVRSFSMLGSSQVKYGLLLSQAQSSFTHVCGFHAASIAKIFNGARPADLPMVFRPPVKLAFNRATALAIGYTPPVTLLAAADIIYDTIAVADTRSDLD